MVERGEWGGDAIIAGFGARGTLAIRQRPRKDGGMTRAYIPMDGHERTNDGKWRFRLVED